MARKVLGWCGMKQTYSTLTELEHDATRHMFLEDDLDDHLLIAESPSLDWSLAGSFLTMTKWNSVLRAYFDPASLTWFLANGPGIWLNTLDDHTRGSGRSGKHLWGACILGFTYQHQMVHIHSRVSFIGYLAPLDLALASIMAQHFSARDNAPVGVVWHLEQGAVHGTKSLPWFFRTDNVDLLSLSTSSRALKLCQGVYRSFVKADGEGTPYESGAFKPTKRFRRRWHTQYYGMSYGEQFGEPARPLEEHPLSSLSLDRVLLQDIPTAFPTHAGWLHSSIIR